MTTRNSTYPDRRQRPAVFEIAAVVLFVVLNLALPFVIGECYPITISPMFCDQPSLYCEYQAFDENGEPIPLETLQLQRVYDGNPPGLGVGIRPKETFDRFGTIPSEEDLRSHVASIIRNHSDHTHVTIRCRVIGPVDDQRVGVLEDQSFEIEVAVDGPSS